jgi:hypothetical protein
MLVRLSTLLDTDADSAWNLVKKISTFHYVARGLLVWTPNEQRDEWHTGQVLRSQLRFSCLIPAWHHQVCVVALDNDRRELKTAERGGPVRKWNHSLSVEPVSQTSCRYTDSVEIEGGMLTPGIWLAAQLFFRYRQMRLRRLVRLAT